MKKEEKSKQVNITHIKQVHKHPFNKMDASAIRSVAYSQFNVAQTILKQYNPDTTVILAEAFDEDLLQETWRSKRYIEKSSRIKKIFPSGLPDQFSDLSSEQKNALVETGGTMILFYLQKINDIYKTSNESEAEENTRRIQKMKDLFIEHKENLPKNIDLFDRAQFFYKRNQQYYDYNWCVLRPRERLVIDYAREAAEKTKKSKVLIIFGGGHNFEECIYQIKDPNIRFSGAIETEKTPGICFMEEYLAKMPVPISGIKALDKIILGSCIVYFIHTKLTTLLEITEIFKNNPLAIELMRHPTFIELIEKKLITVKQVGALTQKQIEALMESSDSSPDQLKSKVEYYLKPPEEKRIIEESIKYQIVNLLEKYNGFGWRNHRSRCEAVINEIKEAKEKDIKSILIAQCAMFHGAFHPTFIRPNSDYTQRYACPGDLRNKRKGRYYQTVQEALALFNKTNI